MNHISSESTDATMAAKELSCDRQLKWPSTNRIPAKTTYHVIKRATDIVVSACVLVIVSPLILLAAIGVKLESAGPIFYRARRAGQGGHTFEMFKLRTMRVGTDSPDRRVTAANDNRVTALGNLLRKFKIDELPQFWNVLCGDMSLVGPRPEDADIVANYFTAEQRATLEVRPGIASSADVRWYPDLTYHDPPPEGVPIQEWYLARHMPAQLAEAARYVERRSLMLDLKVALQTLFCVLVRSWWPPKPQPLELESDNSVKHDKQKISHQGLT